MFATEFKTQINDQFIKVPEYEKFMGKDVRVIVLEAINHDNIKQTKDDFINRLCANPRHIEPEIEFLSREGSNVR